MADTKATAKLLKTIPFLRGLSNAAYQKVAGRTRELTFKAGKPIFREGAQGATLYIVKDGEVDIVKGRGKDAVTLATLSAGRFFGEMSILEGAKRSATIRARSDATLIEVPGDVVMKTLLKHPTVLLATTRQLSRNLRESDSSLINNLKKKNAELRRAYKALQDAQDEIIEKKRLERELELARELQDSLLPRELPPVGEFRFAGRSRPAEAVGGDIFDVIPIGANFFGVLMAGVAGTGLFAAIFMALTRALVASEGNRQQQPGAVAEHVHRMLLQLAKPTMPVSLFYGVVDARRQTLTYVNAGHIAPLLRGADGQIEPLPGEGTQLAASLSAKVDERSIALQPSQTLALYSDGLTQAENAAGEPFGVERLKAALSDGAASPESLIERVLDAVDRHQGGAARRTDQAILVMQVGM